jgi:predicted RNase H-like nuclease
MIVVGVDGCNAGWVAAAWNTRKLSIDISVHATFSGLLSVFEHAKAIAVDIPIGLIECRRACDVEARAELTCRKSSVFPAPDPRVVCMTDYGEARKRMEDLCGKSISAQAFGIYPKVCEVNKCMTPELQGRVIEIHPELCFWAMGNGNEVCAAKRTIKGSQDRFERLKKHFDLPDDQWIKVENGIKCAQPDDVLDAVAAAWSARRWVNGSFGRFPAVPEIDANGIRAEIVY